MEIKVATSEAERLRHGGRVGDLNVVVGRDIALNVHNLATDFTSERFLNITLFFICFPV